MLGARSVLLLDVETKIQVSSLPLPSWVNFSRSHFSLSNQQLPIVDVQPNKQLVKQNQWEATT